MQHIGETRVPKSKNIGNLRPEGRAETILGAGLSECAGRARVWSSSNSIRSIQHATFLERERRIHILKTLCSVDTTPRALKLGGLRFVLQIVADVVVDQHGY